PGPARRDARPEAAVETVAPDQPAQVQVPAFAGGPRGRIGKEETRRRGLRQLSPAGDRAKVEPVDLSDDAREQHAGVPVLLPHLGFEVPAERSGFGAGLRDDEEENGSV